MLFKRNFVLIWFWKDLIIVIWSIYFLGILLTLSFETSRCKCKCCPAIKCSASQLQQKHSITDADVKQQNRSVSQRCCDFTWRRLNIGNSAARGPYSYQFNLKMIVYDITDNEDKSTFRNGYSSSTESSRWCSDVRGNVCKFILIFGVFSIMQGVIWQQ